jgi:hypothetical protein
MARVATWEFEGNAVFDGRNMFAEVGPRPCRALTTGTLEFTFACHSVDNAVLVSNGIPELRSGTFEVSLTGEGAVALACSNGGVEPVRAATPSGFAVEGERVQVTLSWGPQYRFTAVNLSRMKEAPGVPGAGFSAPLPLWARIRIVPGALLTFGAAHRGNPPYFHGVIHRVTLSDSMDAPRVAPPTATVHSIEEHRRDPVRPRRVKNARRPAAPPNVPDATGVYVATSEGERAIEELRVGDEILTRDHGLQPLRWIGQASLGWATLRRRPHLRPVVIRKGALGQGLPEADLTLPPHHRLVTSQGGHEMLLSARTLAGASGVYEADALGVTYTHLQFDRSEIVLRNGIWVEAFHPAEAVWGPFATQRAELLELFPTLRTLRPEPADGNADGH